MPSEKHTLFGYSIYSARYGNIYTATQLLELAEESVGLRPSLSYSWEKDGRFFDPMRPNVEPNGLGSHEEVVLHRKYHLKQVQQLLKNCDVFVFTLGLTEAWLCNRSSRTLPTAPGTIAGNYHPNQYKFINYTHSQIKSDFVRFMELVWSIQENRKCRFLITVSPVPLTATATNNHVLVATTYSKSVLRAVAGELYDEYDEVDYFPSYEIIIAPWSRGIFYNSNLRTVASAGVDAAMRVFFLQHKLTKVRGQELGNIHPSHYTDHGNIQEDDDTVCEDALLESFSV